jgi:hypothetical protein
MDTRHERLESGHSSATINGCIRSCCSTKSEKDIKLESTRSRPSSSILAKAPFSLPVLHKLNAQQLQKILDDPQRMPNWLTRGSKTLVQKDPQKVTTPENYRPITCLTTT